MPVTRTSEHSRRATNTTYRHVPVAPSRVHFPVILMRKESGKAENRTCPIQDDISHQGGGEHRETQLVQ